MQDQPVTPGTIPQLVPLAPLPVGWDAQVPTSGLVLLILSTPLGTSIYPFRDGDVTKLIETLQRAQARARLTLPQGVN